jgi:hypothetical protein
VPATEAAASSENCVLFSPLSRKASS